MHSIKRRVGEVLANGWQSDLGPSDCAACGGDEVDGSGMV